MATKVQRAMSILNAISDGARDAAMVQRVSNAFIYSTQPGVDPTTLPNEEKARIFLFRMREFIKQVVRNAEVEQAAQAARLVAMQGADIDLGIDETTP